MLHSYSRGTGHAADRVPAPTRADNGPFCSLCSSFPTCVIFQEAIQLDGEILFALLRRISPIAYRHLERHKIDPILYMTEWFMCAFSRTLPWASVLRVWDMFLCDGNKSFPHFSSESNPQTSSRDVLSLC